MWKLVARALSLIDTVLLYFVLEIYLNTVKSSVYKEDKNDMTDITTITKQQTLLIYMIAVWDESAEHSHPSKPVLAKELF